MSKKVLRQRRVFSPTLRKEIVGLIESGKLSIAAASREYKVSQTSIYKWIHRYSTYNKKGVTDRIAELERAVGHKQMQIDFYEKFIEFASKEVGEDLKKKYASAAMSGSSNTKNTSTGT